MTAKVSRRCFGRSDGVIDPDAALRDWWPVVGPASTEGLGIDRM
jgi:hypothetical protein